MEKKAGGKQLGQTVVALVLEPGVLGFKPAIFPLTRFVLGSDELK